MKKKPLKKQSQKPQPKSTTKKTAPRKVQKRRIKLKEVSVMLLDSGQCRVSVQMTVGRRSVTRERTGPDETDYQIMLTAQSAIEALQQLTDGKLKMDLLFIERQRIEKLDRNLIVVLIDVETADGMQAATGVCQIKDDPLSASARAVLNAMNRSLELYFQ